MSTGPFSLTRPDPTNLRLPQKLNFQNTVLTSAILLGRVALVRGAAAYSDQTFSWTICRSVRRCVGLSSALWKNGESDPDDVWHHRSDGSRDEAGAGIWGSVHRKGYFWERIWGAPL